MDNGQRALARQEDLVVQEMPEELLVYDLKRHKAYCLNKTAAFVWTRCDKQTTVAEMADLLRQEIGSPVDPKVVWYALDRLGKAGLLEERLEPPGAARLSRRTVMRSGLIAMAAIPTVWSVVAPAAAQAATVIVTNFSIAEGQCSTQDNPVNCEDRCCSGSKRVCVGAGTDWSCTGLPCQTEGPASDCTPGAVT